MLVVIPNSYSVFIILINSFKYHLLEIIIYHPSINAIFFLLKATTIIKYCINPVNVTIRQMSLKKKANNNA